MVFINWYRFDDIDEMRLPDLAEHFADVWLPMAEDPDIFDSTFTWMLSIAHYNAYTLRRLDQTGGLRP
jgi:hypothetical protein